MSETPDPNDVDRRRRRRMIVASGAVAALGIAALIVIAVSSSSSTKSVQGASGTSEPTTIASTTTAAPDTTVAGTTAVTEPDTALTLPTDASNPVDTMDSVDHPTPTPAPTTNSPATTVKGPGVTTVTPTPTTRAPGVPPSTIPVGGGNCTDVGSIVIPATGVNQQILAEKKAYSDGLLCGNHKSDNITEGVDILPGFASFTDSVTGGAALAGKVPAIIFGHRNSHNHPFRDINKLHAGDAVVITQSDGTVINLKVVSVVLMQVQAATTALLAASGDGSPAVRLVACSHKDGTPGGIDYRWIATLTQA